MRSVSIKSCPLALVLCSYTFSGRKTAHTFPENTLGLERSGPLRVHSQTQAPGQRGRPVHSNGKCESYRRSRSRTNGRCGPLDSVPGVPAPVWAVPSFFAFGGGSSGPFTPQAASPSTATKSKEAITRETLAIGQCPSYHPPNPSKIRSSYVLFYRDPASFSNRFIQLLENFRTFFGAVPP